MNPSVHSGYAGWLHGIRRNTQQAIHPVPNSPSSNASDTTKPKPTPTAEALAAFFAAPRDLRSVVRATAQDHVRLALRSFTGRRPEGLPGAYWDFLTSSRAPIVLFFRWWSVLLLLLIVTQLAFMALALAIGWRSIMGDLMNLLPVLVLVLNPYFIGGRVKMRFARELFAHQGRMCLECGYLLEGLPDAHTCPECGEAFEIAELRAAWLYWLTETEPPEEPEEDPIVKLP